MKLKTVNDKEVTLENVFFLFDHLSDNVLCDLWKDNDSENKFVNQYENQINLFVNCVVHDNLCVDNRIVINDHVAMIKPILLFIDLCLNLYHKVRIKNVHSKVLRVNYIELDNENNSVLSDRVKRITIRIINDNVNNKNIIVIDFHFLLKDMLYVSLNNHLSTCHLLVEYKDNSKITDHNTVNRSD